MDSVMQYMDPALWSAMLQQAWVEMESPTFWLAVLKIIGINILLSGDNAVVIALACRELPPRQQLWGMIFGAGIAVVLRILLTGVVATLMLLPYLKLIGGLALLYIAIKLLVPEDSDGEDIEAVQHLWRAIRIVAVADLIMSLDNVVAIAAVAQGSIVLLIFGLGISIPLIVAGAALIMALLDRYPIMIWAGAALLGWIAGEVIATDPAIEGLISTQLGSSAAHQIEIATAVVGAIFVVGVGWLWRRSRRPMESEV